MNNTNAEMVARNFYNWLVDMGYSTDTDKAEDIEDVIKDFVCVEHEAPKLFNLLKNLSD